MDPAMCECVWLMIVVVCVRRLGEEYGCVSMWVWVCEGDRGGGLEGYGFCCDILYYLKSIMSVYYY